jgi:hypothetical protein
MDFPSNANKEKDQPKKKPEKVVEKIVVGEVIQHKKTLNERFKEVFLGGEFKSSVRYIGAEVLLPALRNMVVDATTKGIERVIYGEAAPRRRQERPGPRVSYNSPFDRPVRPQQPPTYAPRGRRQQISNIILASRAEAELVVERLGDIINQFDVATVADLHDLVGLPTTYVDNKWGWTSLTYVDIRQVREGYLIDLPEIEPI